MESFAPDDAGLDLDDPAGAATKAIGIIGDLTNWPALQQVFGDYYGFVDGDTSFDSWFALGGDAGKRALLAARVAVLTKGVSDARLVIALGVGDYVNFQAYWGNLTSLVNLTTAIGATLDAIHAAAPNVKIHIVTPLFRLGEATLIPLVTGVGLVAIRTVITTSVVARAAWAFLHDGTLAVPAPPNGNYLGNGLDLSIASALAASSSFSQLAASADAIGVGY